MSDSETVPQSESGSVFTDHFVLYLDFLGSSEAALSWDDGRASQLIDVLKLLAASRASFNIDGGPQPDGSYKIRATAETSTFSDHIVASYPFVQDPEFPVEFMADMYLSLAQDMVGRIAVHALNVGLLVRGGLTIGKLYHSDGVVFGKGMIDAHQLESRVAVYPRVAISSKIYDKVPPASRRRIIEDMDGIWHLDYFSGMAEKMSEAERQPWIGRCAEKIDQNIRDFETAQKWNEFAKWSWFQTKFAQFVRA